jgi:adenosylcobinamide amidohydrolase
VLRAGGVGAMSVIRGPELVTVTHGPASQALVWTCPVPVLAIASTALGGGVGLRSWVVNVQVPARYDSTDPEGDLTAIAGSLDLAGAGVGFLTAAAVSRRERADDCGVEVWATVGLQHPTWAADADGTTSGPWESEAGTGSAAGTINLVAAVPVRLGEAALVGAVTTVTEAKVQALTAAGVPGTGTASDAVCVLCPTSGASEAYAGPRSRVGAPLARAVHAAVHVGALAWRERRP